MADSVFIQATPPAAVSVQTIPGGVVITPTASPPVAVGYEPIQAMVISYTGPPGPPGPPGAAVSYSFTQASPALAWIVNHNLGVRPNITVLSVGGIEIEAEIIHASLNQVLINFNQPQAGSARCI